jgi:hypothetical protein
VTWVRVTSVMMETSPREEGDDGHNNQLGTKAAATARTVVAITARAITTAARATAIGAKIIIFLDSTSWHTLLLYNFVNKKLSILIFRSIRYVGIVIYVYWHQPTHHIPQTSSQW